MDDLTQHRKKRLEQLIAAPPYNGDRAVFMRKAALSKGRITQLLDPDDQFGELAAERLAEKLGLPSPRWFEMGAPGSANVWPFVLVTQKQIQSLPPTHLKIVENLALQLVELASLPIAQLPPHPQTENKSSRANVSDYLDEDEELSGNSNNDSQTAHRPTRGS